MNALIDLATRLQATGLGGATLLVVLKITLILAVAWLVSLALPRASAAAKHLGLTLALCSTLLLPLLTLASPNWHIGVLQAPAETHVQQIGSTGEDQAMPPTAMAAAVTLVRASGLVPEERVDAAAQAIETFKASWQGMILLLLAAGALLLLARIAIGVAGVWSVVSRGEPVTNPDALEELAETRRYLNLQHTVRLLRSQRITVPVVWGFFQPVLLLPAESTEWPRERLRVVLLHELAHVKRADGITLLASRIAVALFWFHPLAWSVETAARAECERACDDLVLSTGARPSDYAQHLLSIARTLPHFDPFRSVTLAMTRRSQLEGRLLSILQPHVKRGNFSIKAVLMLALGTVFLLTPFAALRLGAAPPQPKSKPATIDLADVNASSLQATFKKLTGYDESRVPTNGMEWYGRGSHFYSQERYADSIEAYRKAADARYRVGASKYNIACNYALLDDEANAVRWLKDAIAAGYDDMEQIARDSDFDPIRGGQAFQTVLNASKPGLATDRTEKATHRYEQLVAEQSQDGGEWSKAGLDLLRLRRLDESAAAFKRSLDLGQKPAATMYNLACVYSRKQDSATAMHWLQKAVENGFGPGEKLTADPDLTFLRSQPHLAELATLADDLRLMPTTGWMKWLGLGETEAWSGSLAHFRGMTVKYPNLGRTWFNLGYVSLQAGQNEESIRSFERALQLGYMPPTTTYNIACGQARSGRTEEAFAWLEKARAAGFKLYDSMKSDTDLESLHDDPRFKQMMAEARVEKKTEK